jgi:hypothetical protein
MKPCAPKLASAAAVFRAPLSRSQQRPPGWMVQIVTSVRRIVLGTLTLPSRFDDAE